MTDSVSTAPIKRVAPFDAARQAVYRYTALALLDPRSGCWSQLSDAQAKACFSSAAELIRNEPAAEAAKSGLGELPLDRLDGEVVLARLPDSEERLNVEFERSFGLLVTCPNPPHETEYIGEKLTFQRSQHLADIAGFYRAFGVEPSSDHPERPDHIVQELEFMAFLIGLERQAAEAFSSAIDANHVEVCRNAQARFLEEHLAWWVPAFARLLSKENPDSFHAAVGELLSAFIPAERSLLGVRPFTGTVEVRDADRPEECDGCLLQSIQ